MNQRIKELISEAVKAIPDQVDFDLPKEFTEKFAELIVRMCADRCEMSPYPHPNYSVAIKKHFGVEE